jgi:hypothetical protein
MTAARVQPPTTPTVSLAAPPQSHRPTRVDRADLLRLTACWTALVRLTVVAQAHRLGEIPTVPARLEVVERHLAARHSQALTGLYAWQARYIHTGTGGGRPEDCPICWAVRTDPAPTLPTPRPTLTVVRGNGGHR